MEAAIPNLFDWSSTPASNGTLDGINVASGMPVQNTDNAIRSLMATIRASFTSTLQNFLSGASALGISSGGTGATTAADARTALGLGALSTASNASIAQGGTGATDAATARTNLGAAAAADVIGASQTWQAVSRSVGSSYQNTTGKPIQISATFNSDSDSTAFQVSSNGSSWVTVVGNLRYYNGAAVIIPNGHYYRATGAASVISWAELR